MSLRWFVPVPNSGFRPFVPVPYSLLLLLPFLLASLVAAADLGRLRIESQPNVEVVWEGVALGSTDAEGSLSIEGIPPGTYELRLHKPNFKEHTARIEITTAEQSLVITLEPIEVVPPPPPPEPAVTEVAILDKQPIAPSESAVDEAMAPTEPPTVAPVDKRVAPTEADPPIPTQTATDSEKAEGPPTPPTRSALLWTVVPLLVVLAAGGAYLLRRHRWPEPPPPTPGAAHSGSHRASRVPRFVADLRQRELDRERGPTGDAVIDVAANTPDTPQPDTRQPDIPQEEE